MEASKKIIGSIVLSVDGLCVDSEEIKIVTDNGSYIMYHDQDCCEDVRVDDIVGNIETGCKILDFIEKTNSYNPKDEDDESFTWTFYTIKTDKGYCDIKWYGTSNGYYSESVDFEEIKS